MIVLVFTGIMYEKSTLPRGSEQEVRCQAEILGDIKRKTAKKKERETERERHRRENNLKNKRNKPNT